MPITQPSSPNTLKIKPYQTTFLFAVLALLLVGLAFLPQRTPAAAGSDLCSANEILFIGSDRPLGESDEPLRFHLIALGQQVTVRSAAEVTTDDAKGKALIIISESIESSQVNTKFRDTDVPVLTWEGWLQDDLGMTAAGSSGALDATAAGVNDKDEGAYGETLGQLSIRMINANHPLAAGYSGEVMTVQHRSNRFHWGMPNDNAIRVAQDINDSSHMMIYAYEQGATMVGLTAPARRVFLHNATAPDLTKAGLTLFLNAVYWAMGCLDEPVTPTVTATATATATPMPPATATVTLTMTATVTEPATLTATATVPPTAMPTFTATATATATATGTATLTPLATPTATITEQPTVTATNTPTALLLSVEKSDLLFIDADENGQVSPGDTLLYTIRLQNNGNSTIQELVLEDQLDSNSTLITGSVQNSLGTIDRGNNSSDTDVQVKLDALAPQATTTIAFQVQINPTSNVAQLTNQAMVHFIDRTSDPSGQQQRTSNDPDTPAPNDATLTPLGNTPQQLIYLPLVAR